MDYTLAAPKLLCRQLKKTEPTTCDSTQSKVYAYGGIIFQRVWVQGVIVKSYSDDDPRVLLDDGSDVIEIFPLQDAHKRHLELGKYLMVIGVYYIHEDEPMIRVHKVVDLSTHPDREAMWYLEVIEACKMFYQPLPDEANNA